MTDELRAKIEEYIEQLRERAANLLGSPTSHRHMGKSEGYMDCADELQALLDIANASRYAEVEALKRDAERFDWMLFHGAKVYWGNDGEVCHVEWFDEAEEELQNTGNYFDAREAIDAAMAKESGE